MSTPQEKARAKKRKLAEASVESLCFDTPVQLPSIYIVECCERVFAPPGRDVGVGECHAGPNAKVVGVFRNLCDAQAMVSASAKHAPALCPRGAAASHVLTFRGVSVDGKAGKKVWLEVIWGAAVGDMVVKAIGLKPTDDPKKAQSPLDKGFESDARVKSGRYLVREHGVTG